MSNRRMMKKRVCCSAPGKVLITGGYMILHRPNSGLVLTVNSRFYTDIEQVEISPKSSTSDIEVHSPQFNNISKYHFSINPMSLQPTSTDQKPNPYTEKTIFCTLLFIQSILSNDSEREKFNQLLSCGMKITILGDNDFYSQRDQLTARNLSATSKSLASLPKFLRTLTSLQDMKKTGLGSSAALVTSLVAALLHYFEIVKLQDNSSDKELLLVHNLAQYCHCLAQGKIGSGFDVSSAVYGSQRYVRFSESILTSLLNVKDLSSIVVKDFVSTIKTKWDNESDRFALPKGLQLLLGDPSVGSNTPIMVSKVLKWRAESPKAQEVISHLVKWNTEVEKNLSAVQKLSLESFYSDQVRQCSQVPASEWKMIDTQVSRAFLTLRESFQSVRHFLRLMGEESGVDIEPTQQRELIDATMAINGVLIAGVPGAGGYDAIFSILLDKDVFQKVEEMWISRKVLPLILSEEPQGVNSQVPPQWSSL